MGKQEEGRRREVDCSQRNNTSASSRRCSEDPKHLQHHYSSGSFANPMVMYACQRWGLKDSYYGGYPVFMSNPGHNPASQWTLCSRK
ncbi:hypothetical protein BaRGS_00025850 [Batillaria attramentaria]|uniref:Uncharacterized protein n=1 Tax=Batillaria attramentaria TaxID=370345 RepID=A0ABD0K7K0_9CAEN